MSRANGARTFLSAYGNKACECFADLRMFCERISWSLSEKDHP